MGACMGVSLHDVKAHPRPASLPRRGRGPPGSRWFRPRWGGGGACSSNCRLARRRLVSLTIITVCRLLMTRAWQARPFDPHYSHSQASSKRPPTSATSRTACSEASSGSNSPTNGINASGHQQRQQRGTVRSVAAAASGRKGCRR